MSGYLGPSGRTIGRPCPPDEDVQPWAVADGAVAGVSAEVARCFRHDGIPGRLSGDRWVSPLSSCDLVAALRAKGYGAIEEN